MKRKTYRVLRAVVIGSGVMGSGIAAQLANAGIEVLLLDQLPANEENLAMSRNELAEQALKRIVKSKPALLYDKQFATRITAGNLEDDAQQLATADWIIEVVVERMEVKQQVLAYIDKWRKPGSLVSSNTSGLSVAAMSAACSREMQAHFAATHFFNPPRYMKLVEIVSGPYTSPESLEALASICTEQLGKGVVFAKDTPNFIANRIGAHGMLVTMELAKQHQLTIEEVDALTGPAIGRPKSATFRMLDVIGLDTLLDVVNNVYQQTTDEEEKRLFREPLLLRQLVEDGRLGEKSGAGFYRKLPIKQNGKSIIEVLQLETGQYERQQPVQSSVVEAAKAAKGTVAKLQAALYTEPDSKHGQFVWGVLKATLLYAAKQLGVIATSMADIDHALKWGFNWELGPFEIWDALGVRQLVERMEREGEEVPAWVSERLVAGQEQFYSEQEQQSSPYISLRTDDKDKIIRGNQGASLLDIGDDVACLVFHSPNNAIGSDILRLIRESVEEVENNWRGLVIANEGKNFCVGANLALLLMEAQNEDWDEVEDIIRYFQSTTMLLKYMKRPVVAAPHRMTLGGGVEVCLPADQIIMSPETYFGLVETGVGLIPAGGGSKEAAWLAAYRANRRSKAATLAAVNKQQVIEQELATLFETIALGKASSSGHEAVQLGLLREQDKVIMQQDNRVAEAKSAVMQLDEQGYVPRRAEERIEVAGANGKALLTLAAQSLHLSGFASSYDVHIASKLAHVLSGGAVQAGMKVSEQYLLDLECEAFLSLCGERKTQDRIEHMLKTGKPLRN